MFFDIAGPHPLQASPADLYDDDADPTAALWRVVPTTAPQDEATTELVDRLRDDILPAATAGSGLDVAVTGAVAINVDFTDYLYRPRRPEELDTAQGGGVVFGQAPHQVEVVRLLGGGRVRSVRAMTARPDARRPTEGIYAAFLTFEDGAFATLTYSGMGHFDSDAWMGWGGELGQAKDPHAHGSARAALARFATPEAEAAFKETRTYGAAPLPAPEAPTRHNHFGPVIVSCAHADLLPDPLGVMLHGDAERRHIPAPLRRAPRAEVVEFARRFDPQAFHMDEEAGRASMFGEMVASGLHTLSAVFGRSVDSGLLADINLGGNQMEVRWPAPVRPDEPLEVSAEVMELRPSRSRADLGIAKFRYIAERQADGVLVLDALVTHFLRR